MVAQPVDEPDFLPLDTVLHGDALVELKKLPSNSVDAIVVDPPSSINFMSREWDSNKGGRTQWVAWLAEVMAESLRVLKYGGHALVWSLPRTSHWTGMALEDAGFQIRDCLYHVTEQDSALGQFMASLDETQQNALTRLLDSQDVPSSILALFGQGFPKSTDVDKQIDKLKGMEREVIGQGKRAMARSMLGSSYQSSTGYRPSAKPYPSEKGIYDITAPASPDAQRFSGVGTNLKPSVECWWLCRKPLEKGLTIAENCLKWGVGGLAIDKCRVGGDVPSVPQPTGKTGNIYGFKNGMGRSGEMSQPHSQGRWPSHLLLTHAQSCTEVCVDNCPVKLLDEQSGISKSVKNEISDNRRYANNHVLGKNLPGTRTPENSYSDSGGVSRFFQQFHPDPFIYCSKASRRDRSANGTVENTHPTTKNTALISYFCKLICPEGGIILDPFFGSGTLGVSAIQNGFHFIGIEQSLEYCTIAQARIDHARTEHDKQEVAPPSLWDGA